MKLSLDPAISGPRAITPESLSLAAWYDAHPAVRRMWAIRQGRILRVIVALEPAMDSSDICPAWLASRQTWVEELRSNTGCFVELELIDEPPAGEIETSAEGDIVVALCWRDPALETLI